MITALESMYQEDLFSLSIQDWRIFKISFTAHYIAAKPLRQNLFNGYKKFKSAAKLNRILKIRNWTRPSYFLFYFLLEAIVKCLLARKGWSL